MRFVVDVQPLRAAPARFGGGEFDQAPANAPALIVGVHSRVEQKGVNAAVPRHVYEADKGCTVVAADVGQAAREAPE